MGNSTLSPQRIAKWDNTKAFLILMVVFGHAVASYASGSPLIKSFEIFVYSFHMPLFIFIGGLFAKRTINTTPFRYEKVVSFFLLNLGIKLLNYLVSLIFTGKATFTLLSDNAVSWYIFAMGAHLLIAHFLRKCDPKKILVTSIIVGILIGYVNEIGNTLVLSRIFVFFPIFYLGYMLDSEKVLNIVNKPVVKICSVLFLLVLAVGIYLTIDISYFMRRLLTGNNPYYEFGGIHHLLGGVYRIISYVLMFTSSFAVLSIMPNKHLPVISYCGTKTLQVYALHRPIQRMLGYLFLTDMLKDTMPRYILIIMFSISLVLTLILSLKPFDYFIYPFTNWNKIFAPVLKWYRRKEEK